MQRIPIIEIVFCHTHKQFHLSHVTLADPDSSNSCDFTRTSVTEPSVSSQSNSKPTKVLLSARKKFSLKKILFLVGLCRLGTGRKSLRTIRNECGRNRTSKLLANRLFNQGHSFTI